MVIKLVTSYTHLKVLCAYLQFRMDIIKGEWVSEVHDENADLNSI